ncbi:MAG: 2Fe-2S iron-sulfur cluster binding domain-containing protein [Bacteroidota bacterium]
MIKLTIHTPTRIHEIQAEKGSNLRKMLLQNGISPYTRITQNLNCGGNGICATCGVWIIENEPAPSHWHDKAAKRFGYPRLSCQITVEESMTIELVDKWIWGGRTK